MVSRRQTQVAQRIAEIAAEYFARESNQQSLITVTRADISPDLKNVLIFLSVLPEAAEQLVLDFAKRSRSDVREFIKKQTILKHVPTIDFEIDYGEKNRQLIDHLTR